MKCLIITGHCFLKQSLNLTSIKPSVSSEETPQQKLESKLDQRGVICWPVPGSLSAFCVSALDGGKEELYPNYTASKSLIEIL